MTNAHERANARTMPADRRAFLRRALTAGAVAAVPVAAFAASSVQTDQRTLDLWRRRKIVLEARDRILTEMEDAEARMPAWARTGPKYLQDRRVEEVLEAVAPNAIETCGWPAIQGLTRPTEGGKVLLRPNNEDLFHQFHRECDSLGRDQARRNFLASINAFEGRCTRQKAEKEKSGYAAAERRSEEASELLSAIEDQIDERMRSGVLQALAAAAIFRIASGYDDEPEMYVGVLRALRPTLSGSLAEGADAALAKAEGKKAA